MKKDGDLTVATVTTTTTVDGKKVTTTQDFKGTEAEVKAQIEALSSKESGRHMKMKKIIKKEVHEEHEK